MPNLLNDALPHLQGILPNQSITLYQISKVLENGFPKSVTKEINCVAQIQPLSAVELSKIGDGLLNSQNAYKFYILGNLIEVGNFLNNESALILWNKVKYRVYSKHDFSQNGWIKVIATAEAKEAQNV